MNIEEAQTTRLTPYQNRLKLNRKYYQAKYDGNINGFRDREIQRNKERVKKAYHENPEVRQRMRDNALARYYRLKSEKEAQNTQE
jgi:hypothetical protein